MGTPFSTVYDFFMMLVTDYKLNNLYTASVIDFETFLSAWLLLAIADFINCNQSLAFTSTTFDEDLTQDNIKLLAQLMKKYWLEKEIDNITQMNLHVTDKDFKVYAEANNMTAKQKRLILDKEELSQLLVDYSINSPSLWTNFLAGDFYTP